SGASPRASLLTAPASDLLVTPPRYRVFRPFGVVASFFAPLSLRERGRGEGREPSSVGMPTLSPTPLPEGEGLVSRRQSKSCPQRLPEVAAPRGYGASSTCRCSARALEAGMAQPRDGPYPLGAAAPSEG